MKQNKNRIIVIGGSNIDIEATSTHELIDHDSNPGRITYSLGGVARNICQNLVQLGFEVSFLTALSTDTNGTKLKLESLNQGIDLSHAIISEQYPQSTYLCINDADGEMILAINDMDIIQLIDQDYLSQNIDYINSFDYCVFDTNLEKQSIDYLIHHVTIPTFMDMVSVNKCMKLKELMKASSKKKQNLPLHFIKANKIEAELLSDTKIENSVDAMIACAKIKKCGIENVCVTLGKEGSYLSTSTDGYLHPAIETIVKNTTGAGDAYLAGYLYGVTHYEDYLKILKCACTASAITCESVEAVSPSLTEENLRKRIN